MRTFNAFGGVQFLAFNFAAGLARRFSKTFRPQLVQRVS